MLQTLILIPTEMEAALLQPALKSVLEKGDAVAKICGFGPIASGIRTAQLIAELKPRSCLLLGIAGTFTNDLAIGSAHVFTNMTCFGIGAGSGSSFVNASQLEWQQWPEPIESLSKGDVLDILISVSTIRELQLLTVCAISACEIDVEQRLKLFPNAAAEDMEGFAVGLACHSANVPLTVIRGISNRAGDRDKSNWQVKFALESAGKLAAAIFGAK